MLIVWLECLRETPLTAEVPAQSAHREVQRDGGEPAADTEGAATTPAPAAATLTFVWEPTSSPRGAAGGDRTKGRAPVGCYNGSLLLPATQLGCPQC